MIILLFPDISVFEGSLTPFSWGTETFLKMWPESQMFHSAAFYKTMYEYK